MEVVLLMLITTTPLVSFLSCAILNIDVPLNVNLREKEFRAYCINSCKHILQMGKNDRKCSIPGLYCYFLFSSIFFSSCRSFCDVKMIHELTVFSVRDSGSSISKGLGTYGLGFKTQIQMSWIVSL